jgi:U4/U6 small nuclear ribonucleoprotein PRP31
MRTFSKSKCFSKKSTTKHLVHLTQALVCCDEAFVLNDAKRDLLLYLESRMSIFCPNLATLLSASLAAKLICAAGGLKSLASMPSGNLMVVGANKKAMLGMAGHSNYGLLWQCDLVVNAIPSLKNRAIR